MAISKYTCALGQMPPDDDGWRAQAVILLDAETDKIVLRLSYDDAARRLLAVVNPAVT